MFICHPKGALASRIFVYNTLYKHTQKLRLYLYKIFTRTFSHVHTQHTHTIINIFVTNTEKNKHYWHEN